MRSTALPALVLVGAAAFGVSQVNAQSAPAAPPFEAGKHYTVLSPAQPTSTDAGKVEVAEVFMFGCGGCFNFEPHIQRWLGKKADYVNFVRIPAPWNAAAVVHARAYYTAEALGKVEEIDGDFFNEIHTNRNMLETEAKLAALFAKHGVDEATFKNTFNSFAVNAKSETRRGSRETLPRGEHAHRHRQRQIPHPRNAGGKLRGVVRDHRRLGGTRARRSRRRQRGTVSA